MTHLALLFMDNFLLLPDVLILLFSVYIAFVRFTRGNQFAEKALPKTSIFMAIFSFLISLIINSINNFQFGLSSVLFMKAILLGLLSACTLVLNNNRTVKKLGSSLYFLLFTLTFAIMLCLSANGFLILTIGLELYNFSICFLLLPNRKAAIRFLLTSSVMTAIFLFGISLLYSQFGSFAFDDIKCDKSIVSTIGFICIISGFLFKLGIAPFHSWMIDIYEKSSLFLVIYLNVIWKFFIFFVFANTILSIGQINQQIIHAASILSMAVGGVMSIFQWNIKRFVAFATVGHMGFLLSLFSISDHAKILPTAMTYLTTYCFAAICFFVSLIVVKKHNPICRFSDLSGLIYRCPSAGIGILLSMFAMIGMPPFANFMAKMEIFNLLINSQNYTMLSATIAYSVLCVFYVAKHMRYLFKRSDRQRIDIKNKMVITLQLVLILSFFLYNGIHNDWNQILTAGTAP